MQCRDGKFASRDSQKKAMDFRGAAGYKFDCDDSIADSIIQLVYERPLAGHDIITDEDGHLIIYGFWDNEEELRSIILWIISKRPVQTVHIGSGAILIQMIRSKRRFPTLIQVKSPAMI